MFKKFLIVLLCLSLCLCSACGDEKPKDLNVDRGDEPSVPQNTETEVEVDKTQYAVNPLTGVANLAIGKELDRPDLA